MKLKKLAVTMKYKKLRKMDEIESVKGQYDA